MHNINNNIKKEVIITIIVMEKSAISVFSFRFSYWNKKVMNCCKIPELKVKKVKNCDHVLKSFKFVGVGCGRYEVTHMASCYSPASYRWIWPPVLRVSPKWIWKFNAKHLDWLLNPISCRNVLQFFSSFPHLPLLLGCAPWEIPTKMGN